MISPISKRISSPSSTRSECSPSPGKRFVSSPRGNKQGRSFSLTDTLFAGFLRYFKWILVSIAALTCFRLITVKPNFPVPYTTLPPETLPPTDESDYLVHENNNATSKSIEHLLPREDESFPPTSEHDNIEVGTGYNDKRNRSIETSNNQTIRTQSSKEHDIVDENNNHERNRTSKSIEHILPREDERKIVVDDSRNHDNLLSRYKASNSPVILDGWNRTVQVHLIVDVTGSTEIDPASKMLLAGVKRSNYLQFSAVTFVRPEIETIVTFPRNPSLPLLYLVDWGSMNRDCHRLQLVLESIETDPSNEETISDETEEPYFLLIDSSGSTRRTGCTYLFDSMGARNDNSVDAKFAYGRTNDKDRIRLAKRSIVENRYYDRSKKKIHLGNLATNEWEDVPEDYDRPVLQSSFPLRESFVMGIENATEGKRITEETDDSLRPTDVGYFWNSGDYSHYGFYRREIAKVVKTLHHSSLDKKAGTRMENLVALSYSDEKGMAAGNVQFKYTLELTTCKIVVITQRDEWEDHYRLMESVASGALVMTDRMISLPEGFEDKVNIVIYDDPQMLKKLIRHYLKPDNRDERRRIAFNGYELVMGNHRCWHRLEELIFGRPLTNSGLPYAQAPEKKV